MKRARTYSPVTRDAATFLGSQVRIARLDRRWSERELADRAGITPFTLRKVEAGDPTVALGIAFEVAALVNVPLFYEDAARLAESAARVTAQATLLPRRVRRPTTDVNDDF